MNYLNRATVHHRLCFGDNVLAPGHCGDLSEGDQTHDTCKLYDFQQGFVFKCRLDEVAHEPAAYLVNAAVRIAVHRRPCLLLNLRQKLVLERGMLF